MELQAIRGIRLKKARYRRVHVRISYDVDVDFLWALEHGVAIDGQPPEEFVEVEEGIYAVMPQPSGRTVGFGVEDFSELDPFAFEHPLLRAYRFDAPTLGLQCAWAMDLIAAAQTTLDTSSTPDVVFFDLAVASGDEPDAAESFFRLSLAAGDMKAHFGLGYTLCDLGRPREGYGHLRTYTEIVPRNSWAWTWRGQAAELIGEEGEAERCYRRAIRLQQRGSYETDAHERLAALERPHQRRTRRDR